MFPDFSSHKEKNKTLVRHRREARDPGPDIRGGKGDDRGPRRGPDRDDDDDPRFSNIRGGKGCRDDRDDRGPILSCRLPDFRRAQSYLMISLELSLSSAMCTPPLRGPRRDRDDDDDPRFRKFGGRDDRDDGPRAHPTAE